MKIIAKTEKGFLIEADRRDLAALLGYTSTYDNEYDKIERSWGDKVIGQEFDIVQATQTADYVRNMDTQVLVKAQREFERIAEHIEETRKEILKLNLFDKLKQQEQA